MPLNHSLHLLRIACGFFVQINTHEQLFFVPKGNNDVMSNNDDTETCDQPTQRPTKSFMFCEANSK